MPDRKVGMVTAFTGYYASVAVLARFLELSGIRLVRSRATTPSVIEAGTTYASADFCFPLRVYVGHVHHLLRTHRDLDAILAPNVLSQDGLTSTCSKYRDVGGVAIRSLGDTIGYLLRHDEDGAAARLASLAGDDTVGARLKRGAHLPTFIMPDIRSLDRPDMRNLCYSVYADVMGWQGVRRAALFVPGKLLKPLATPAARLEQAFETAYQEVVGRRGERLESLLADASRPRLALVGRRYLIHDPALSCDVERWFERHGACVITADDVPFELLRRDYEAVDGFYDSHKEAEAFIRWALPRVDGFICLGSFGCHPDAFQVEYLAQYVRSRGAPCWVFQFDESAGSAGFHTRFETVLAFLEQRRDRRLAAAPVPEGPGPAQGTAESETRRVSGRPGQFLDEAEPAVEPPRADPVSRRPLIVWPYMGEVLNLLVEEAGHQLGLEDCLFPPAPLAEEAMLLGNDRYTGSCSPYACSTGSLKDTVRRALETLEERAAGRGREPRRIIVLMARGEGPCTFGWYAIVQNRHLAEEFRGRLAAGGHTLEMVTVGLDGFVDTLRDVCRSGKTRLQPIVDFITARERGTSRLPRWRRAWLRLRLVVALRAITRPLWAKLDAVESLRARALVLRAHEAAPGSVTAAYHEGLELLRRAHTVREIAAARRRALSILESVPRDHEIRPRVVVVGEIYVVLTSFANRGTVENLLAREGIEVVGGTTLGGFIRATLREMRRRMWWNKPWLRPALSWLRRYNVRLLEQRTRDPRAHPFINREVGGEGLLSVAHARHWVEKGCDGIVHLYPFKCMPEGMAKDAVKEVADLYGVRYLSLSFDRETETERLRTEVGTFASLLYAQLARTGAGGPSLYRRYRRNEVRRRRAIGRLLAAMHAAARRRRRL